MRTKGFGTVVVAALAVAVRLLVPDGTVSPPCALPRAGHVPGLRDPGRLLFGSETGVRRALYAIDPDGSDRARVAPRARTDHATYLVLDSARWSPDRSHVAWEDRNWVRKEVHVATSDGRNERVITSNRHQDNIVGWTPDGESIVVGRPSSDPGLYLVQADGSTERRITPTQMKAFPAAEISPGGRVLVVEPLPGNWSRLYTVDPPWKAAQLALKMRYGPVTFGGGLSPDGNGYAAPTLAVDLVSRERSSIALPGTEGESVAYSRGRWSPDGERIVYVPSLEVERNGRFTYEYSIVVTTPRGDCFKTFELPSASSRALWSPDGKSVVFSMAPPGKARADVYILNVETGRSVNVTSSPKIDETLSDWR